MQRREDPRELLLGGWHGFSAGGCCRPSLPLWPLATLSGTEKQRYLHGENSGLRNLGVVAKQT